VVGAVAIGALLATYVRTLPKLVEQPEILPSGRSVLIWRHGHGAIAKAVIGYEIPPSPPTKSQSENCSSVK
jgi:hypothetical protein